MALATITSPPHSTPTPSIQLIHLLGRQIWNRKTQAPIKNWYGRRWGKRLTWRLNTPSTAISGSDKEPTRPCLVIPHKAQYSSSTVHRLAAFISAEHTRIVYIFYNANTVVSSQVKTRQDKTSNSVRSHRPRILYSSREAWLGIVDTTLSPPSIPSTLWPTDVVGKTVFQ